LGHAASAIDNSIHLGERIWNLVDECQLPHQLQEDMATELEGYDAEAKYHRRQINKVQIVVSHNASKALAAPKPLPIYFGSIG